MTSSSSMSTPLGVIKTNKAKDKSQLNHILSPASPLFLPLNQLDPHCSKLFSLINDDKVSRKELAAMEQNLWREVKKLRALQDKANIFTYLIGYYHTIMYQLVKHNDSDDIFQYQILIRLGDLNSYGHAYNQLGILTRTENFYKCCYYYARAAKSSKKPLDKNLAESNLRIVIIEHDNTILDRISNDDPSLTSAKCVSTSGLTDDQSEVQVSLPKTAFDWFYVMVIAIYFDNIRPIAKPFMNFVIANYSIQRATIVRHGIKSTTVDCGRETYLLMASLDILLDWLKFGKQGKAVCILIGNELRQIRASLSSSIDSLSSCQVREKISAQLTPSSATSPLQVANSKPLRDSGSSTSLSPSSLNLTMMTEESSTLSSKKPSSSPNDRPSALPHDCVLKGFKPLESVHEKLRFPKELPVFNGTNGKLDEFGGEQVTEQCFIGPEQLMQILNRIKTKIDSVGLVIKRKTRNIALESILSSMNSFDQDS